jgi:hypothetical protein
VFSRWDGSAETLDDAGLRDFADLCIVNELDVLAQQPALLQQHGDAFRTLFDSWRPLATPAVSDAADALLTRAA